MKMWAIICSNRLTPSELLARIHAFHLSGANMRRLDFGRMSPIRHIYVRPGDPAKEWSRS